VVAAVACITSLNQLELLQPRLLNEGQSTIVRVAPDESLTSRVRTECDTSTDKARGQLCTISHKNAKISRDVNAPDSTAWSFEGSAECLTLLLSGSVPSPRGEGSVPSSNRTRYMPALQDS
jgi:hypothetical protein